MRHLTDRARTMINSFGAIATQDTILRLQQLYDSLERRRIQEEYTEDELLNIVKRCKDADTDELETKYRQLLSCVQLVLWIDQWGTCFNY